MIPGINKQVFNFHDLILIVALAQKHLRLMILLVCMCSLAGIAVYIYSRPVYLGRSLVQVEELALPVDSDTVYHDSGLPRIVTGLESPAVMERTARRLGVNASYREIESKYIKRIAVSRGPNGDDKDVQVEVYAYNQTWAARWAELMIDEFLKMREEDRENYRASITKSWGDVIGEAGKQMDANLDKHFDAKDQSKLINATIDMNRLHDLPVQLVQVKQRIDRFDEVIKKLDDPSLETVAKLSLIDSLSTETELHVGQVVGLSGTNASGAAGEMVPGTSAKEAVIEPWVTGPPEWQVLDKDQRRIEGEILEASRIYLPGHKKMVTLNTELEKVRKNLEIEYQSARNRLELQRQSLLDQQLAMEKKLPEYEEINHRYAKLQQDNQLHDAGQVEYQNIYTDAERYINELNYTADKERVNLRYMGLIDARPNPVSPNKLKLLLLSFALGCGLAIAVPFLIEYLDFTLSNMDEVEATFQIRGLGIVPQFVRSHENPLLIGSADTGDDALNLMENFRLVRTNLLAMGSLSKPPRVLMVTSTVPKEGKTVICSNLALSFGQMAEKTLLMDTDLRRGRLHRLFGLRKSPGLSDVLLGTASIEDALRPSGKENLTILSAGQHLELGTELLGSQKFADLMQTLKQRFDRILMDTPPVLGLSETSILQNHVDGVIFVIWSGRTPIRTMKTAIDILSANGANFYGFVLNRLDLSSAANYYQYYYYSGDYYQNYHALENA
jgi:capsular exopolysaccharide synthesis family protein